jgi:DNA-binding response OmpR family regulator
MRGALAAHWWRWHHPQDMPESSLPSHHAAAPAAQDTAPPTSPAPSRRALLVDDEPVIRFALRRFFQRQGWAVDEAEDGRTALAMLLDDSPHAAAYDVIVTDLRMPGLSGIELYTELERARPALIRRLILSTGDSVSGEASAFLKRSACPVLNKPFELAELRALVERVIAQDR